MRLSAACRGSRKDLIRQAWITTIAHRRSVDRVRSAEAARRRDVSWHDTTLNSTEGADFTQACVEALDIEAALAQSTALQRHAIELAYFDGHTSQDVARLMGAPLGTTKTRIRDARARLPDVMNTQRAEIA